MVVTAERLKAHPIAQQRPTLLTPCDTLLCVRYGGYHHHSHYPFAQRATPRPPPPGQPQAKVHTVTFVLSDGDNVHWLHDGWLSEIWTSKLRGSFALSLGFNPSERDLGQPLVEWLYQNATSNGECPLR